MTLAPYLCRKNSEQSGGTSWQRRVYAFTVVAMAVLLTGLLLVRTPVTGHVARITVVYASPPTQPGEPSAAAETLGLPTEDQVKAAITSPKSLRGVQNMLVESDDADTQGASPIAEADFASQLRERLTVSTDRATKPGETRIAISYVGETTETAAAVARRLANHLIESHKESAKLPDNDLVNQKALETSVTAMVEYRRAQEELDEFLAEHFQCLQSVDGTLVSFTPDSSADSSITENETAALIERYKTLKRARDDAHWQHLDAVAAERDLFSADASEQMAEVRIVAPAHIVGKVGGGVTHLRLTLLTLIAAVIGGLVAWRPAIARLRYRPEKLARAATVLGEIVVVAVFFVSVFALISNENVATRFAEDPLGTYVDVPHRWIGGDE